MTKLKRGILMKKESTAMKKSFAMLLALLLIFALFAGCAGDKEEAVTAAPTPTAATPTAAAPTATPEPEGPTSMYPLAEPVTISVLGAIYTPRTIPGIETWQDTIAYQHVSEATNIWLDYTAVLTSSFRETFMIQITSGDYADMVFRFQQYYSGGAEQAIEDGVMVNIADYLEYAPDYVAAIEGYGYTKDVYTDNGYLPSFYCLYDGPAYINSGPVVRKDLLDELEMDVPVTLDDYYEVLTAMKVAYGMTDAFKLDSVGVPEGDSVASAFGIALYSEPMSVNNDDGFYQVDGKVKFGYIEEGFVEYVELMNKWYSEGLISGDFVNYTKFGSAEDKNIELIQNRTAITYSVGFQEYDQILGLMDDGTELLPILDPVKSEGDTVHLLNLSQTSMDECYSITTGCENIEAAVLWNNYWYTEDGSQWANWGEEGVTYDYDAGGNIYYTDLVMNNPDGYTTNQTTYVYTMRRGIYDRGTLDTMNSAEAMSMKDIWANSGDNKYRLPTFASMTAEESERYNLLMADIITYCAESLVKFVTGEKKLSEVTGFQDTLKGMNVEECVDIWQDTIDRYNQR